MSEGSVDLQRQVETLVTETVYLPHSTGLESDGNGGYTYGIADLNGGGVSLEDGEDRYVAGQAGPKTSLGSN